MLDPACKAGSTEKLIRHDNHFAACQNIDATACGRKAHALDGAFPFESRERRNERRSGFYDAIINADWMFAIAAYVTAIRSETGM